MIQLKKPALIIATIAVLGISGVGAYSVQQAHAAAPAPSLIDALVQRFGLNKADVQQVFDANKAAHQADRKQHETDRLAEAVKDGKLTQAQADLITAKQAEIKIFMNSLKDKTPAEKASAMKIEMDSLKQWATDNKIPPQFVGPFGFMGKYGTRAGWHKTLQAN
jgi:hypothetical protein